MQWHKYISYKFDVCVSAAVYELVQSAEADSDYNSEFESDDD